MFFITLDLDRLIFTIYFCLSLGSVLRFWWRRSPLKIGTQIHSDILKVKLNFPRRDFWNGSRWIQWDTEVRKNSVKVEFERVAAAPLTPLIGSKWCFHFINNSGSRTKKGPSRLKSEGGKTQKYKMKLERELLLLISMPEFQSRHKKKRS